MGPGHSDDTAIVCAGLLLNRDVALGVFLADAIDTLEKYVNKYSDQDNELARLIADQYKDLNTSIEDVHRLIYLSTIPEKKVDVVPTVHSVTYFHRQENQANLVGLLPRFYRRQAADADGHLEVKDHDHRVLFLHQPPFSEL
jgi:hypothetical protein